MSTQEISTKPYFIRALYEWCMDNGYTPYLSVVVNAQTRVPAEFVRDGEIVLNISALATNQLLIQNDHVEFQARFSGTAREIYVPIENISAIYARETGQGMAFNVELTENIDSSSPPDLPAPATLAKASPTLVAKDGAVKAKSEKKSSTKPTLTIVK